MRMNEIVEMKTRREPETWMMFRVLLSAQSMEER